MAEQNGRQIKSVCYFIHLFIFVPFYLAAILFRHFKWQNKNGGEIKNGGQKKESSLATVAHQKEFT